MKKIVFIIFLLLAVVISTNSCIQKKKPAPIETQNPMVRSTINEIQWRTSLSEALAEAKKLNKPIMIDFYTDWCSWCKKLDKEVYTDTKVIDSSQNFISVKIDGDKNKDLIEKYGIRGYPTVLFLNPDGSVINTSVGYVDADEFLSRMKRSMKK